MRLLMATTAIVSVDGNRRPREREREREREIRPVEADPVSIYDFLGHVSMAR